jgi:hypothetical protein
VATEVSLNNLVLIASAEEVARLIEGIKTGDDTGLAALPGFKSLSGRYRVLLGLAAKLRDKERDGNRKSLKDERLNSSGFF